MSIQDAPIWQTLTMPEREALLERAAIMEYDAKLPREEAERRAIQALEKNNA